MCVRLVEAGEDDNVENGSKRFFVLMTAVTCLLSLYTMFKIFTRWREASSESVLTFPRPRAHEGAV